jgi:hypothetical protein
MREKTGCSLTQIAPYFSTSIELPYQPIFYPYRIGFIAIYDRSMRLLY